MFGQTIKAKGGKIESDESTAFEPRNNKRKRDVTILDVNVLHDAVARRTVCSFCAVVAIILKPNEDLLFGV
jgi:hypothetical protein